MSQEKIGFLKNHGEAIAVVGSIAAVNIALGGILIALYISNVSSINTCMTRIDNTMTRIDSIYELLMNNAGLKLPRKPEPFEHSKGFRPYDDVVPQPNDWMIKDTKQ